MLLPYQKGVRIMKLASLAFGLLLLTTPLAANAPYAGQQERDLKALSATDLEEINAGAGWGLAKVAELNGVPGPAHLLELKNDIPLTAAQVAAIEAIYAEMKADAIEAGARYIAAERALEMAFRDGQVSKDQLASLLEDVAQTRRDLQFVHLSRHLSTPPLLSPEQIARYNMLRGYGAVDPCANPPAGHDPDMWRRHNNCG